MSSSASYREIVKGVPFSESLPDVSEKEASRCFQSKSFVASLVKDVDAWGASAGGPRSIHYKYVFVVFKSGIGLVYYINFEESVFGTQGISVFESGGDGIIDFGDSLVEEQAFVARAVELVQEKFGERLHELSPRPTATHSQSSSVKKSWLSRLISGE